MDRRPWYKKAPMLSGALGVPTVAMGNRFGWGELGTGRMPWMPATVVASRMPNEPWVSRPLCTTSRTEMECGMIGV